MYVYIGLNCLIIALLWSRQNKHNYGNFFVSWNKKGQKNDGNFLCVFECTIVNLATYRQFTNAAWDWIIKKKKLKQKQNKSRKKKIKIAQSLGYPSSYFYNKRCNLCCSNGYIYHFLDYIKLLLFVNANVIHHV